MAARSFAFLALEMEPVMAERAPKVPVEKFSSERKRAPKSFRAEGQAQRSRWPSASRTSSYHRRPEWQSRAVPVRCAAGAVSSCCRAQASHVPMQIRRVRAIEVEHRILGGPAALSPASQRATRRPKTGERSSFWTSPRPSTRRAGLDAAGKANW